MPSELRRRRFIQILPAAGLAGSAGLLAACSEKPAEPAPAPAPAPAPTPAPEPSPSAAAEPAAAPQAEAAASAQPSAEASPAPAPAGTASLPMLDESSPNAQSLAYVADNRRVDAARHPNFAPDQNCANCALFQAPAGAEAGGCPLFAGHWVAAAGWCSAWVRRA